ncbi:MAG: hypothetical protein E6G92_04320 [Alphaproteobacteria bacterium]|nr:MAG: hypothetical protein E6G92_04320 [Alphaproteobacteria bacterium]
MAAPVESLKDFVARLEREAGEAMRRTTDNGYMTVRAADVGRVFELLRGYGGVAGWRADEKSIAALPPPVRAYVHTLQDELQRLMLQVAAIRADDRAAAAPVELAGLVDPIATVVDYAAFYSGAKATSEARARRRRARETAREILALLGKWRCLAELAPVAEERDRR